jgi:hypothetical protein
MMRLSSCRPPVTATRRRNNVRALYQWIAYALPGRVCYWVLIRVFADVTTGKYSDTVVPELTALEALDRWGKHVKY